MVLDNDLKSDSHLPKKIAFFALLEALWKRGRMLCSQDI